MNDKIKRELQTLALMGGIAGWLWFVALGFTAYYLYSALFSQGTWWHFGCAVLVAFMLYHYALYYQQQGERIWRAVQMAEAAATEKERSH